MSFFACGSGDISDRRSIVNRPSLGIKYSDGFSLEKIDSRGDIPFGDSILPLIKDKGTVIAAICGNKREGYTLKPMKDVTITNDMVKIINEQLKEYNLKMDNYISDPIK